MRVVQSLLSKAFSHQDCRSGGNCKVYLESQKGVLWKFIRLQRVQQVEDSR